jgi:hypothetical protein
MRDPWEILAELAYKRDNPHTSDDVYQCECEACQTWCKEQDLDHYLKDE